MCSCLTWFELMLIFCQLLLKQHNKKMVISQSGIPPVVKHSLRIIFFQHHTRSGAAMSPGCSFEMIPSNISVPVWPHHSQVWDIMKTTVQWIHGQGNTNIYFLNSVWLVAWLLPVVIGTHILEAAVRGKKTECFTFNGGWGRWRSEG